MHITSYEGILFIEESYPQAKVIQEVNTTIGGLFKSSQLSSLADVKANLAAKAKAVNANAVINFQYGQKSVGIFQSMFSRDDVNWYGKGTAVSLSKQSYSDLLEMCY